jgi:hypothetical protein
MPIRILIVPEFRMGGVNVTLSLQHWQTTKVLISGFL